MSASCVHRKTLQPLPSAPPRLRALIACVQGHLWYSAAVWSWIRLQRKEQYEKELWEASSSYFAWKPHLNWGLHPCTLQSYVAGKPGPEWPDFLAWRQTRSSLWACLTVTQLLAVNITRPTLLFLIIYWRNRSPCGWSHSPVPALLSTSDHLPLHSSLLLLLPGLKKHTLEMDCMNHTSINT